MEKLTEDEIRLIVFLAVSATREPQQIIAEVANAISTGLQPIVVGNVPLDDLFEIVELCESIQHKVFAMLDDLQKKEGLLDEIKEGQRITAERKKILAPYLKSKGFAKHGQN